MCTLLEEFLVPNFEFDLQADRFSRSLEVAEFVATLSDGTKEGHALA